MFGNTSCDRHPCIIAFISWTETCRWQLLASCCQHVLKKTFFFHKHLRCNLVWYSSGARITLNLPSAITPKIITFSSRSVFFISTPNSPFSTSLFNRLSTALPRQFAWLQQIHHVSERVPLHFLVLHMGQSCMTLIYSYH